MSNSSFSGLVVAAIDALTSSGTAVLDVGGVNFVVKFSASNYVPARVARIEKNTCRVQ